MAPWQDAHGGQAQPGGGMEREAETLRNEWRVWGLLGCPPSSVRGDTEAPSLPVGSRGRLFRADTSRWLQTMCVKCLLMC